MWLFGSQTSNRLTGKLNILVRVFWYLSLPGGLAEEVDEKVLHAAFIPFGDIIDIQIPLDYETGKVGPFPLFHLNVPSSWMDFSSWLLCPTFSEKHRGFAFIEFELAEVCAAEIPLFHSFTLTCTFLASICLN